MGVELEPRRNRTTKRLDVSPLADSRPLLTNARPLSRSDVLMSLKTDIGARFDPLRKAKVLNSFGQICRRETPEHPSARGRRRSLQLT